MRVRETAGAIVAAALALSGVVSAQAQIAEGITLVVSFDERPIRLLAAFPGSRPGASALEPQIDGTVRSELLRAPDGKLKVLAVNDGQGRLLYAGRLPSRSTSFAEVRSSEDGSMEGGLFAGRDVRLLHFPVENSAAVVSLIELALESTGELSGESVGEVKVAVAGAWTIRPGIATPSNLELLDLRVPLPLPVAPLPVPPDSVAATTGEVVTIVQAKDRTTQDAFDIVVLGDGFQATELPRLEDRIRDFARRLLGDPMDASYPGIAPYSRKGMRERISIHLVRTASRQSHVTYCPCCSEVRDSYFEVLGNFSGSDYPADYDTTQLARLYSAVRLVGDLSQIEAVLMVPNCDVYGGRGFRDRRLAFASAVRDWSEFANLAAHELAHAVADLGDEYLSCDVEREVPRKFRNIATPGDLKKGAVWWTALAEAHELVDPTANDKTLRVLHGCGSTPPAGPDGEALGLFWGGQFIDAPGPPCNCDLKNDARLCGYYRPMAACKMRELESDFCRVCQSELEKVILRAAP